MSADSTSIQQLSDSVRVEAQTWYLVEQSHPGENRYCFSYTISIYNDGDQPVQLLTRHWLITDADGKIQEVHGDGVIGEQPEIAPGDKHVYTSGAVIESPVGTMEGRYGMVSKDGVQFDAHIPVFRLAVPGVLN